MMDGFLICIITLSLSLCSINDVTRPIQQHDSIGFDFSFVGNLLKGQTVGVIGAGRIGSAYARMMVMFQIVLMCF